jgi:acyl-CoA oxidase
LGTQGAIPAPALFDVWNDHLSEATEMAATHALRLALECFNGALDQVEDIAARGVLDRLLRLFALEEIAEFSTALLADGVIDRDVANRIEPERERLSTELLADASLLTDAYDLPMSLLDAPIGGDYIEAYDGLGAVEGQRSSFIRTVGDTSAGTERTKRGA